MSNLNSWATPRSIEADGVAHVAAVVDYVSWTDEVAEFAQRDDLRTENPTLILTGQATESAIAGFKGAGPEFVRFHAYWLRNVACRTPLAEGAKARKSGNACRRSPRILTASPTRACYESISNQQPKAIGLLGNVPALRGEAPFCVKISA